MAGDVSIGPFVVGGNCCNKCNFSFHFHHITGLSLSHYLLLCITNISRPTTSEVIIAFQGRLSGLHLAHSDGWNLEAQCRLWAVYVKLSYQPCV